MSAFRPRGGKIIFRHDSIEKWRKVGTVPAKDEIIVVEFADGSYQVRRGDGITPAAYLPKIKAMPAWFRIIDCRLYGVWEVYKREDG